jgi:hypothetical protein
MEANRTDATAEGHKGNCCADNPAANSQEKSAKSPDKDRSRHVSPSDAASNGCCCGDAQKAKK